MKTEPMLHQVDGTRHIVEKSSQGVALFDEQGTGKTKQAIDAAWQMHEQGELDLVVVVCPAGVRGGWDGLEYGQIITHSWDKPKIGRWDARAVKKGIQWRSDGRLKWVVTSYSFLRNHDAVHHLIDFVREFRTLLILDEAHFIKSRTSQQGKGVAKLREYVDRCVLLTGTPYVNDVTDLWHQLNVMNSELWPYGYWSFRATFAKTIQQRFGSGESAKTFTKVVGVNNKERLDKLVRPFVKRRLRTDCVDLPPKTYSVIETPLGPKGWEHYSAMEEDLITWMDENRKSSAKNAGIRILRLSQIASGWLGGIRSDTCERCGKTFMEHPQATDVQLSLGIACDSFFSPVQPPISVDTSKQDAFLEWRESQESPVITWARFTKEVESTGDRLERAGRRVGLIYGRQSDRERQAVLDAFQRGEIDDLVGNQQAGGVGLNLMRAHTVAYLSNDYSLTNRLQSEDRVYRIGQQEKVSYTDFLATSPSGGATIDHLVLKAIRQKIDLASYTMEEWRTALGK